MKIGKEELSDNKQTQFNDEVDLTALFHSIGRTLSKFIKSIQNGLNTIFKRKYLVLFIVGIGLGLSYLAYVFSKPYYSSSMTMVLSEIRNQFVENQLSRLSVMIEEGNFKTVAEELEISFEEAKEIREMKFINLDEELISNDSILTGSPFEIELSLYDNSLFNTLEPALANYLENNRYFFKQKLIKQKEVESMISKLKDDILALDSIKTSAASPRGPVNGFVYGEPIDPSALFREGVLMYQQQITLESELEQLDNIQIVNGFTPRMRPTFPKLFNFLIVGGAISFVVGVIVALNLESRRKAAL